MSTHNHNHMIVLNRCEVVQWLVLNILFSSRSNPLFNACFADVEALAHAKSGCIAFLTVLKRSIFLKCHIHSFTIFLVACAVGRSLAQLARSSSYKLQVSRLQTVSASLISGVICTRAQGRYGEVRSDGAGVSSRRTHAERLGPLMPAQQTLGDTCGVPKSQHR